MKKLLVAAGVVALVAVVVVAGLSAYLLRRLNPKQLEKTILEQARATLGTELKVRRMDISLLSGVTLEGVVVDNPAPFAGELLSADAFVLRYRLRSLLGGRVEVERLALEKPALAIAMDARGVFNYEKLGARGAAPTTASGSAAAGAVPLRIVMKSLAVEDGRVAMIDAARARLMVVEDIDFGSTFELAAGAAHGRGDVSIASVSLADTIFVRRIRAPLSMTRDQVALAPIKGDVAGGVVTGDVKVDLKGFRYTADVELKGAKVKRLLEEAKSSAALSGTLSAKARFEGSGGLATVRGKGSADVASCRSEHSRVLALLSGVLQVPELANPDFETCHVEFTQTGSRFATPVLRMTGDAVRLSGSGSLNLDTSGLDYQMTLALAPALFAKITRPELRGGFEQKADGFAAIDFRLFGTTLEPKTDLLSRVGKAAAKGVAKDQLNRLLKRKGF